MVDKDVTILEKFISEFYFNDSQASFNRPNALTVLVRLIELFYSENNNVPYERALSKFEETIFSGSVEVACLIDVDFQEAVSDLHSHSQDERLVTIIHFILDKRFDESIYVEGYSLKMLSFSFIPLKLHISKYQTTNHYLLEVNQDIENFFAHTYIEKNRFVLWETGNYSKTSIYLEDIISKVFYFLSIIMENEAFLEIAQRIKLPRKKSKKQLAVESFATLLSGRKLLHNSANRQKELKSFVKSYLSADEFTPYQKNMTFANLEQQINELSVSCFEINQSGIKFFRDRFVRLFHLAYENLEILVEFFDVIALTVPLFTANIKIRMRPKVEGLNFALKIFVNFRLKREMIYQKSFFSNFPRTAILLREHYPHLLTDLTFQNTNLEKKLKVYGISHKSSRSVKSYFNLEKSRFLLKKKMSGGLGINSHSVLSTPLNMETLILSPYIKVTKVIVNPCIKVYDFTFNLQFYDTDKMTIAILIDSVQKQVIEFRLDPLTEILIFLYSSKQRSKSILSLAMDYIDFDKKDAYTCEKLVQSTVEKMCQKQILTKNYNE